jgi:hypothetical protein
VCAHQVVLFLDRAVEHFGEGGEGGYGLGTQLPVVGVLGRQQLHVVARLLGLVDQLLTEVMNDASARAAGVVWVLRIRIDLDQADHAVAEGHPIGGLPGFVPAPVAKFVGLRPRFAELVDLGGAP